MSAPVSSPAAALAELRAHAADHASALRREGWNGAARAALAPGAKTKQPVGTAHARDRAKFESAFTNQVLAELFEAAHSVGPLKVLPRTDGKYIVFDPRKPPATATVAGPFEGQGALELADTAMRALARKEGLAP